MSKKVCILRGNGSGFPEALVGEACFSWKVEGEKGYQKSYRLVIGDARSAEVVWDTQWVKSRKSAGIIYDGTRLLSNHEYFAKVSVETERGVFYESDSLRFFTGLKDEEWKAKWLKQYNGVFETAPIFRKVFTVSKKVRSARMYVTGLGYYEAYVNGEKVGDHLLDPARTTYQKRVFYAVYEIGASLREGANAIGVQLGRGWFCILDTRILKPIFSMQLMLEYEDGSEETIISSRNSGWMMTLDGPILKNDIFAGEVYDARKEIKDWCTPQYQPRPGEDWRHPLEMEPPAGVMRPQNLEPIKCVEELAPKNISQMAPDRYVVDFGVNIAGVVRIKIDEAAGTMVKIRHAEIVDDEGEILTQNLRTAKAEDIYISSGESAVYQPRFTYHGFRYAEITGLTRELKKEDICAVVIRSAVEKRSEFDCGDELINQIQEICVRTESNNLYSIPTDCPQRDERLGWLNDPTVRADESIYNFELYDFYVKFVDDIVDVQGEKTGIIADTIPFTLFGNAPADPVCSSFLLLPWLLYLHYGDRKILEKHYNALSRWTLYLDSTTVDGIVNWGYYGDWSSPIAESVIGSQGAGAVSANTPRELMSTGYLLFNARLMKKIAKAVGKDGDVAKWEEIAHRTEAALNKVFYDPKRHCYASGSQGSNTFMLYLDVMTAEQKNGVLQSLVQDILDHEVHLTTGNMCSKYILEVLAENGHLDLAYNLITQTTYPSWGYMISKGATTTWERWEYVNSGSQLGMASHDHPMYATVSAWFYKYLLGVQPTEPGYEKFDIKPYFPTGLEWVAGCVPTVKGDVPVRWERRGEEIELQIGIPFNSTCIFTNTTGKSAYVDGVAAAESEICLEPGDHRILLQA